MKMSTGLIRLQRVADAKLKNARQLRQEMANAEKILWKELRNRRLSGYKFRRQQVIEGFVADFYCEQVKLVIEVDGDVHKNVEQKTIDEHRTRVFAERGITTIRFQNENIEQNLCEALDTIKSKLCFNEFPSPCGRGVGVR